MELRAIVQDFANQLSAVIERQTLERARQAVTAALGGNGHLQLRRGRPPAGVSLAAAAVIKTRRKAPKQLCPVPGCKNAAAPVFGMVCAKHKDVPKAKIRQYREARRAQKLKGKAGRATAPARGRKRAPARKPAVGARPALSAPAAQATA
jgi:hypothetical protein